MAFLSVGIDVAKATFTVATWTQGAAQRVGTFPNTPEGCAQLAQALPTDRPIRVTLEPTGGYELALAQFALGQGWEVCLPNPRHVRDFAKSRGRRGKSDPRDAALLARYGVEGDPPVWHPLPDDVAELESLQRRKDDLEQLLRQERNRRHALGSRAGQHPGVPASVERIITALEGELAAVEQLIREHLGAHPALQAAVERLRTVPGVGAQTVVPLLILLWRWQVRTEGAGSGKGVTAYVGLDPQPYDSGTSVHKPARISREGDKQLRRRLYMAALGGIRGQNPLRAFYERLVGRGKRKKVALVAAARKIVVWAWKVFQTQTIFDPTKTGQRIPA